MSNIKVKDIMRREVIAVKKDTPVSHATREMIANNITGMPVINDDMTLAGIISEKDMIKLLCDYENSLFSRRCLVAIDDDQQDDNSSENDVLMQSCNSLLQKISGREMLDLLYEEADSECVVADLMTEQVVTLDIEDDLTTACRCFMKHSFRRAPILSDGKLVGIITRKDIINHIYNCQNFFKDVSHAETVGL